MMGSHIRLQKQVERETLRITIPKRSTLAHILKQAGLGWDEFLDLL